MLWFLVKTGLGLCTFFLWISGAVDSMTYLRQGTLTLNCG